MTNVYTFQNLPNGRTGFSAGWLWAIGLDVVLDGPWHGSVVPLLWYQLLLYLICDPKEMASPPEIHLASASVGQGLVFRPYLKANMAVAVQLTTFGARQRRLPHGTIGLTEITGFTFSQAHLGSAWRNLWCGIHLSMYRK